ncbi:hypothetical protein MPTK1_1g14370 [Marchantia polymorpha subsp. ruderalis]|uniref:Uncharacterized protein n=2 Tax=Marchantia polymorpha TaxID=3197 RepID=A0AAF6AQ32_MARPO|nr:hypothetical protein MARPO_0179s0018 [Marchantia polymorpha]BBM98552.1 hypothetical protein Mp_1g14370 [Marchantia polymorpha subsp. ruderalis]|eukprot:PTQ27933.1 hypothetical protein MARPO_0179s0018 [Marchantia polymorpha]
MNHYSNETRGVFGVLDMKKTRSRRLEHQAPNTSTFLSPQLTPFRLSFAETSIYYPLPLIPSTINLALPSGSWL